MEEGVDARPPTLMKLGGLENGVTGAGTSAREIELGVRTEDPRTLPSTSPFSIPRTRRPQVSS